MSDAACPVHDELVVQSERGIDAFATLARIRAAVDAGQLRLLRADSPLELTEQLVMREVKYSFVHFLECQRCGQIVFFGIHIRGMPVFKTVTLRNVDSWPWDNYETQIDNMPEYRADHAG